MLSPTDIFDMYKHYERIFQKLHSNMDDVSKYYFQEYTIDVPEGFEPYISPLAKAIADTDVAHVVTSYPIVTVPPQKDTKKAQEQADKLESAYKAFLHNLNRKSKAPPLKQCATHGILYGMWVLKGPFFLPDVWDQYANKSQPMRDWETEKRGNFPFYATPINPRTCFFDPDQITPNWFLEVYERTIHSIVQVWGRNIPVSSDKKLFDTVTWIEYNDNLQRLYGIMEGKEIKVIYNVPNIFGYIPYSIGFSGMGDLTEDTLEKQVMGVIWPIIPLLRSDARSKTALDALLQLHAFPAIQSAIPLDNVEIDVSPGKVSYVPEEAQLKPTPQITASPDLYRLLGILASDIERTTHAAVVEGQRPVGVQSGYQQAVLVGQARLRYETMVTNLGYTAANMLGNWAQLVEQVVKQPVPLYGMEGRGVTIQPSDIAGHYYCEVDLFPAEPTERDRRSLLALQLYNAGLIDHRTALEEYIGLSDASQIMSRMLVDKISASPQMMQLLAEHAAKEAGLDEELAMLQSSEGGRPPKTAAQRERDRTKGRNQYPGYGSLRPEDVLSRGLQRLGEPGATQPLGSLPEGG